MSLDDHQGVWVFAEQNEGRLRRVSSSYWAKEES